MYIKRYEHSYRLTIYRHTLYVYVHKVYAMHAMA